MKKHIGSFQAVDDAGKTYTIDHYREYERTTYLDGKSELSAGRESYTCGNSRVNFTGDKTFYIVLLDTEVKKVD